jgi:nicotinamide riboside kinase
MFGPESTGKKTLAIQLADHYKTAWVPEFARDYLQEKWDKSQLICDVNDMLPLLMAKLNLKITACPSLTSICSATQTY